eukprot:CAMPEP_0174820032 /NCGR_PEP_ID=MMETSP1107-20130205/3590_1 /TAXON_ID=36770 /ORGANISM="Paraphysomonas vestita, Strain GFlagA" /LENGTH=200 /DNA_ID=CAMNT_0016034579 /DNA_START=969 /DNA_END=1571 /DNA_ORIENTATION=-
MSLTQIYQAKAASSQGSGSNHEDENKDVDVVSDESSIRNDEIDVQFQNESGDVGVTIWNEDLVDFHQGTIKIAAGLTQDKIFSFADVYSSSENDDDDLTFSVHSGQSESSNPSHKSFSSNSLRLQGNGSSPSIPLPLSQHPSNLSRYQRHGSISSMSSQSQSQSRDSSQAPPIILTRIYPTVQPSKQTDDLSSNSEKFKL